MRLLKHRRDHDRGHPGEQARSAADTGTRHPAPGDRGRADGGRDGRGAAPGSRDGRPDRAGREPSGLEEIEASAKAGPDGPTDLPRRSWPRVLVRTVKEFKNDELSDRAAALTYYAVLSLFPALLVMVSILGAIGESATNAVLDNIEKLAPGSARDILRDAVKQLGNSGAGLGSLLAAAGLLAAVWSASGYVAAFIRAANIVYDVPEGRPVWKVLPLRLAVTVLLMVLMAVSAVIVVFTGGLADQVGKTLGVDEAGLQVWSIAKWPVLVLLVVMMIAVLYWAAPNAKVRGFRWLTPGSALAVVLWLLTSAGFALYVANFGSYNKTYGTLAGVIIFLVWLWLSNLAILLGLEFDAELARARAIAGGLPPDDEPYVEPRDTRAWPDDLKEELEPKRDRKKRGKKD